MSNEAEEGGEHWISVSDLMSGLGYLRKIKYPQYNKVKQAELQHPI